MNDRLEPAEAHYRAAVGLLAVLALVGIWLPAGPIGVDTPTHLYFAQVLAHPERFAGLAEANFAPTSQVFVWACVPALWVGASLGIAAKVAETLVAALAVSGAWAIGAARGERRPTGPLFALAATQTFYSAMGFWNFVVAVALGLWLVAACERAWRRGASGGFGAWILVAVAGVATAVGHVIVAGMFGLHAVACALATGGAPRERARRAALTAVALAPAGVYSVAVALAARAGYAADDSVQADVARVTTAEALANTLTHAFGGSSPVGALAVAAVAIVLASRRRDEERAGIEAVGLLWLAVYLAIPYHGLGWAWAQVRVLAMPLIVLPTVGGWGRRPAVVLAAVTALLGAYLGAALPSVVSHGDAMAAQASAFGDVPPGRAMEVIADAGAGAVEAPLLHAAKLALANGGASALLPPFSPMIHSVRAAIDEWPPHPPLHIYRGLGPDHPDEVARQLDRVAVQGLRYDTVVLVGADAWRAPLEARGYVALAPAVLRANPTSLQLLLHAPPEAASRSITVRVGYPETLGWFAGGRRGPAPPVADGDRLLVAPIPAGPAVVRVSLDETPDEPERILAQTTVVFVAGEPLRLEVGGRSDADRGADTPTE
ncbi:MAG: hypothetical protein H6697_04515 [Myxococcales bacterium]|nr:hypothetical protein [Myxococcales bacterium]MCB9520227.1 hypothetical protein [Myxococcales bacterium]